MIEIKTKSQGAELTSIKHNGREILHQGERVKDQNGKAFWSRYAPILFPMVGKLKDNKTLIAGNEYHMTQHGFARDMDFEIIKKEKNEHKYKLIYSEETLAKFPFKFELYVTYKVKEDTLEVIYNVINVDDKEMLFGIGSHPAFICDYSSGNFELEFEKEETDIQFYKLTEGLINNSSSENILHDNKIQLNKNIFDEDAIIMKKIKSNKIKLVNTLEQKDMLEFDYTGFPILAIWAKQGAPFVCLEPWFNTADSITTDGNFESKDNILRLNPNGKFECSYKIKMH